MRERAGERSPRERGRVYKGEDNQLGPELALKDGRNKAKRTEISRSLFVEHCDFFFREQGACPPLFV